MYLGGFAIEFGITLLLLSASSPLVKLQSFDFSAKLFEREQPTVVCVCADEHSMKSGCIFQVLAQSCHLTFGCIHSLWLVCMHFCSHSDGLPCRALPVKGCFGQPLDWHFSVSEVNPNWKKNLQKHVDLHQKYLPSAEALLSQADVITYNNAGTWQCTRCSETMVTVGTAVHHRCLQKRGPAALGMKLAPKRPRVQAGTLTAAERIDADIPAMPDLQYTDRTRAFAERYDQATRLASLNMASLTNLNRLSLQPSLQPCIGDFFEWPGEPGTFACIIGFAKRGRSG